MNERIRAHDLWTQVCQEDMPELDETFMTMRRTRKFAELIVQEAGEAFWSEACHVSDLAYEEYYRNSKKIKQHFGVEE